MNSKHNIQLCITTNCILLTGVIFIISQYSDLKYGYSKDLVVLGITIDTMTKYLSLHIVIFITEFVHSLIFEYANPILYFNIFDDSKRQITEFTKFELQLYAQMMWFLTSVKNGFMLLVSISQIDIILCKLIYGEIAIAIVIRNKLNNKSFQSSLHTVLVE